MNPVANAAAQRKSILIIDDTPANISVLAEYLVDCDFDVLVAQDGEEGLQRAQWTRPDLIMLDVMMPGIDGFETCRRLKAMEETKDIPVIFMTTLSNVEDKIRGFDAGGVDYITKPLQIKEVLARVGTHLNLHVMQQQLRARNDELLQRNAELKELNEQLSMAQTQLMQSEKLASIGQLAAGVAHEINNPIGFILSNLGTLKTYVDDVFEMMDAYEREEQTIGASDEAAHLKSLRQRLDIDFLKTDIPVLVSETRDGAERVKQIVQDLRDFSRVDSKQEWEWANLHRGIDSTLNIVASEIKYKADVIKEYGEIPEIQCLPSQLNQVILNLVVNAVHAIEGGRGKITIRTGQEQQQVWIEIADTGCGIPPENLGRIFDPFFTTKPVGKGTGLGLALSYGIIQKHQGEITVRSEVGKGTCFRIVLPIQQKEASAD